MNIFIKTAVIILIGFLVSGYVGCKTRKDTAIPEDREILIVYSGNTLGELKPCGCAKEEDQGGIERRMGYLKELFQSEKNILLVDTGDNFKEPTVQGKIKAEYLMKSVSRMNYDAILLGEKDFVYGKSFLTGLKNIPWLSANIRLKEMDSLPAYRIKQFSNDLRAAVIGITDPDLLYGQGHSGDRFLDAEETLKTQLRKLRSSEKPDLIILLSHMRRERALKYLDIEGVDIIINGHIESDTDIIDMNPVEKNGKIFVQPGPRGQKIGELRVTINSRGEKFFQQRMAKLGSAIKLDEEMTTLYNEYNSKVEEIFFASLSGKKKRNKEKMYATEAVCKNCHADAHKTWLTSRHARAYDTLRRVNKAFDPECLACHVVGLNEPGGFISEIDTPGLKNVQCEACHGAGLKHAEDPHAGFGNNAREACKKCHVKNHSPRFKFSEYWPKIRH